MQLLEEIRRVKVAVIGDVMLDRYWWGSVSRISPEAPVPIVQLERMSLVAGGAGNVAANLAGLGATPYLFGIKGVDEESRLIDAVLSDAHVKNHRLIADPSRRTTIKTRIVAHSQHVVRIDQETAEPIAKDVADELGRELDTVISEVDVIVISDYAKGCLSNELLAAVIKAGQAAGKPIVADPKGRDFSKYAGVQIITPNKREAADACLLDVNSGNVVARAGRQLIGDLGLKALLITEGENGMTVFDETVATTHLPTLAHNVYDVTGAGDTVIAAFAAALAAGAELVQAARFANAAAGLVVENVGTTTITSEMLAEFFSTHENALYIHA